MVEVGPVAVAEHHADDADLAAFVDRLAAAASDRSSVLAQEQIRRAIDGGQRPPGLCRLAEALAASVAELTPAARRPVEDVGSVVAAMRGHALVVLEDVDDAEVAAVVAALLADGRRVIVTAPTHADLASVRGALPSGAAGRTLDRLPALPPGEIRELRRLLATSTPGRRARTDQQIPGPEHLPSLDEVAHLCGRSEQSTGTGAAEGLIPMLLADLPKERRDAVTSVARCASTTLGALHPKAEREWAWSLLSDLTYDRHRPVFDRMLEDAAQVTAALDRARRALPVAVTGQLPADAADLLCEYREFLEDGGQARSYFRSTEQRRAQPVLDLVRVDGRIPETEDEVTRVIEHIELGERLGRLTAGCAEVGIPAPRNESELDALADGLVKVGAAARSVGALRHDVLFIAPGSPLSVPDVEAAEQVASAILDYAEHGSAAEAQRRLEQMTVVLASRIPVPAMSPEHEQAIGALADRDAVAYAAAVEALEAARREARDETRRAELLRRLSGSAPRLATAWTELAEREPAALGLACFLRTDALLAGVPSADSADVVLVLGAAGLGVERLLLTAVAPRMIAVVGPGKRPDGAPTLLSVLQRASALVIRGRSTANGQVVRIADARPAGVPGATAVGQAGA